MTGFKHTPVREERLVQTPVLYSAVVEIVGGGKKSEVTELEERVVTLGVEGGLSNTLCNWVAIVKPSDVDHRRKDVVHQADQGVGKTQGHRRFGKHGHFRDFYNEDQILIWISDDRAMSFLVCLGELSHSQFPNC